MSNKKIIIYSAIILILSGVLFLFYYINSGFQNQNQGQIINQVVSKEIVLSVDDGGGEEVKVFNLEFKEGMTAFDALKQKTAEKGLILETKSYDIGVFIENIGGVKNGENGKYWVYYVNGKLAEVASDKYQLKAGDKVEFKFEKSIY